MHEYLSIIAFVYRIDYRVTRYCSWTNSHDLRPLFTLQPHHLPVGPSDNRRYSFHDGSEATAEIVRC